MDQTGKRIVGEVVGPLNQGQSLTLDCVVTGGKGPPLLSTLLWEKYPLGNSSKRDINDQCNDSKLSLIEVSKINQKKIDLPSQLHILQFD